MIEFDIAIAVILLLALIWFFLKHKKKSSTSIKNAPESVKPIKQESRPADKITPATESVAPPANEKVAPPPVEPENKPLATQTSTKATCSTAENSHKNLPQDSMLRRHYLTNLRAIITALSPAHPTDATLRRHYDAQITAKIEQCLDSKEAMQQLMRHYENHKKTLVPLVAQKPQAIAAKLPPRPTDSMLARHYDAILENR